MLCGHPPFYGQCGYDCGWERGENCQACQDTLFNRIKEGNYEFPEREWFGISEDAKDLIRHLLVCDPHSRYSAQQVLNHPWVAKEAPMTPLITPILLNRYVKVTIDFLECDVLHSQTLKECMHFIFLWPVLQTEKLKLRFVFRKSC